MAGNPDLDSIVVIKQGVDPAGYITDPHSAYLFSQIQARENTLRNLAVIVSGVMTNEELLKKIKYYQAIELIQLISPETKKLHAFQRPQPGGSYHFVPLKRNYNLLKLDETADYQNSQLHPSHCKELHWLCRFGVSSTYYNILGLPPEASTEEIRKVIEIMTNNYSEENIKSLDLGEEKNKFAIARRLIQKTTILLDSDKREKYDFMTLGQRHRSIKTEDGGNPAAFSHFGEAIRLSTIGSFKEAVEEIDRAIALEPGNPEFVKAREKLVIMHKEYKIKDQLAYLRDTDFTVFGGDALRNELEKILALDNYSGQIHLRVAELLTQKHMLVIARKIAAKAAEIDRSLASKVKQLTEIIDKKIRPYETAFGSVHEISTDEEKE